MKVLIVPSNVDEVGTAAHYLASRLVISGIDALVQDSKAPDQLSVPVDELALVVCRGGDGTFLRAARLVDFAPVPMLALNYGTLSAIRHAMMSSSSRTPWLVTWSSSIARQPTSR